MTGKIILFEEKNVQGHCAQYGDDITSKLG